MAKVISDDQKTLSKSENPIETSQSINDTESDMATGINETQQPIKLKEKIIQNNHNKHNDNDHHDHDIIKNVQMSDNEQKEDDNGKKTEDDNVREPLTADTSFNKPTKDDTGSTIETTGAGPSTSEVITSVSRSDSQTLKTQEPQRLKQKVTSKNAQMIKNTADLCYKITQDGFKHLNCEISFERSQKLRNFNLIRDNDLMVPNYLLKGALVHTNLQKFPDFAQEENFKSDKELFELLDPNY